MNEFNGSAEGSVKYTAHLNGLEWIIFVYMTPLNVEWTSAVTHNHRMQLSLRGGAVGGAV